MHESLDTNILLEAKILLIESPSVANLDIISYWTLAIVYLIIIYKVKFLKNI